MLKKILFNLKNKNKKFFLKDYLKADIEKKICTVGKWSYGNPSIFKWDKNSRLKIGNFCSLGPEIKIYLGGEHRADWVTTFPFPASQFHKSFDKAIKIKNFHFSRGDIHIGNDVWIGGHTIILSGSIIGDGCIIGAGSVVRGSLEPFSIYAGNPIKKIRNRFKNTIKKKIINSKWWNLDDKIINEISINLCSNNYKKFFKILENKLNKKKN